MSRVLAFSIFCEDVRHEKTGQRTLVGILGDGVSVPEMPSAFPRMAVFSRVTIPIEQNVAVISLALLDPDGNEIARNEVDPELVENSKREAIENGNPVYGVTSDVRISMIRVERPGVLSASVDVDGSTVTTFLNVILTENR